MFTLADPSEAMIKTARENLHNLSGARYLVAGTQELKFYLDYEVITTVQAHHYMQAEERRRATECVYEALKPDGIYIFFENVRTESEIQLGKDLARWGMYQRKMGKSEEAVKAHLARCGKDYFPITIKEHIELLNQCGFQDVDVFWKSYMQAGIVARK